MTPVEIFALIIALGILLKLIVGVLNPKAWLNMTKKIYASPVLIVIVSLILGAVVLKYLLVELTIVQIYASMLFLMFVGVLSLAVYVKEMLPLIEKILKRGNILKKAWLPVLIWFVLTLWVLKELLLA